VNYHF